MASALDNVEIRQAALGILRSGGVVVLPTDTLPGFATAMSSSDGINRIDAAKCVATSRPYVLLASSVEMVERYVASFGCCSIDFMRKVWPAPLSVVLNTRKDQSPWGTHTLAFRVPDVLELRSLIDMLGEPIVSTSVNVSGTPTLVQEAEIRNQFGSMVDLIVGGQGTGKASTLVDLTGDVPDVLREGDYPWAAAGGSNPSK